MRNERLSGKNVKAPFDPLPQGFDAARKYHVSAFLEILPNFPFGGQQWAKDRWEIGVGKNAQGRYCHSIVRKSDGQALQPDAYPPEAETADEFTWTPDHLAQWKNLARKHANRPAWWQETKRSPAAGYVYI